MPKFTKKPVEVEARQFDGTQSSAKAVCAWMAAYGCEALRAFCGHDEPYQVYISTLEGRMTARAGDWIIRGVKGEFYPCKPDIFAETYETSTLSHAAGHDGEQCRAASGESRRLDVYVGSDGWKARPLEERLRIHADDCERCADERTDAVLSAFQIRAMHDDLHEAMRALSRGVPEGCDSSAGAPCGGFRTKHGEHFDILYRAFTYASATDAKRLDWLAHHGASLRNDCQAEGGGWFVIAPYHTGISSVDGRARFATARAAIDAAMEGDE